MICPKLSFSFSFIFFARKYIVSKCINNNNQYYYNFYCCNVEFIVIMFHLPQIIIATPTL